MSQQIERCGGRMEPNWLNPREHRAWRAFIDAHHLVGCT